MKPVCRENPRSGPISHEMPQSPRSFRVFAHVAWKFRGVFHTESQGVAMENFTIFSPRNSMVYKTGTAILQDRQNSSISQDNWPIAYSKVQ